MPTSPHPTLPHPSRIPRPAHTPDALRAALARLAPARLDEMQATKDDAFAEAVEWRSLTPVQSWILTWAREIEIARRPALSARYAQAKAHLEDPDPLMAKEALEELSAVLNEATRDART
ncbi:hypothetical protein IAG44_16060 [Streptomyces roseirectus]|uniref:Uncharacterized protein n=1 Tax=Streptomyces roseirectus TaxID=2768066 RepID=A0A7H0IDD5_9ACTN|nr:hypothetical protein [Streptomyces roseirectus]QNP70801.1 hypothetical protein IAG44_16060 [Streptomyces roseirectus]